MILDLLRQLEIFKPDEFEHKRIDVVGTGAVGSYVIWTLSKMGLSNIHIWDYDIVESHNVANQCFMLNHIGKPKIDAVEEMVKNGSGIDISKHFEKVDNSQKFGNIVFLLVDSMTMRKKIWDNLLKQKLPLECVIEARMGSSSGRVYTINPHDPDHIEGWENTLCDDNEAEVSVCGSSISVAPTVTIVSSIAVWQLIKWLKNEKYENEVLICSLPWTIITNNF